MISEWKALNPGMLYSILAYNVYIAPLFAYLSQLVQPTQEVLKCHDEFVRGFMAGPGNWITFKFCASLKHLGFPSQLCDIRLTSMSAMRRYYANTNLDIDEMGTEMFLHDQYRLKHDCLNERCTLWHERAFTTALVCNLDACIAAGINNKMLHTTIVAIRQNKFKGSFQNWLYSHMQSRLYTLPATLNFIRHRLARWNLQLNPAIQTIVAFHNFKIVAKRCRPNVSSAYSRTLLNGWCTERRLRTCKGANAVKHGCAFGCIEAVGCIEHYAHCPVICDFFHALGCRRNHGYPIDWFLILEERRAVGDITDHAKLIYEVFTAHFLIRKNIGKAPNVQIARSYLKAAAAGASARKRAFGCHVDGACRSSS